MPKEDGNELNRFTRALAQTLDFEGGVDMHAVGKSGISNMGVTQRAFDDFNTRKGREKRNVKTIALEEAQELYYEDYWQKPGYNKLPMDVALQMFDYGVNAYHTQATKDLQKVVGAKADGIIGPKTLEKVDMFLMEQGPVELQNQILDKRQAFYDKLVKENPRKYKKFKEGWDNRIQKMRPGGEG